MRNIYLVDDDDAVRASLHSLLSLQPDLAVRSFRSGDVFLEDARALDAGVLLLDFHMPGMNGIEVLNALGESDPGKFATVILTGEGNVGLAVQAMKAGALDFIEKPYEAEALIGIIDAAFSRLEHDSASAAQIEQEAAHRSVGIVGLGIVGRTCDRRHRHDRFALTGIAQRCIRRCCRRRRPRRAFRSLR